MIPARTAICSEPSWLGSFQADDEVFSAFIHDYGHEPVDENTIFRISLQRVFHGLFDNENRYIKYKTMDGRSDALIRKRLRISLRQIREIIRNIRRHIDLVFAT